MSTINKGKNILMVLISIVLLTILSVLVYVFLRNYEVDPDKAQEQRIAEVKGNLVEIIPDKYEVIESDYESPSNENDGCVFLYQIYPKAYSDMEKEYLRTAEIIYCQDINKAVLKGQVDEVKYSDIEGKWLYESKYALETKQYGSNLVSIVELGGSHALSNFNIVRIDGSDELIILSVPSSNRIRCDTFENGTEIIKEDCVAFRDSINNPSELYEWVPSEIYQNYYNELLNILKEI